tara:strand:+ start:888 stop:1487 length:600 start_codon:yes stop_codon:yes gene_type:complete
MNLLTQNSKLKKTSIENNMRVMNFSLPAYKTITGKTVCPFAKDCIKYCYAQKGNYKYPSVIKGLNNRYNLSQTDEFIPQMNATIVLERPTHVRIHDSGDFYSIKYLAKWVSIAKQNKEVIFYAYTKSIKFFTEGLTVPTNLKVIFSEGSKIDNLIDVKKDRHARIFKSKELLNAAGYIDASENDLKAITSNKKVGLVYH